MKLIYRSAAHCRFMLFSPNRQTFPDKYLMILCLNEGLERKSFIGDFKSVGGCEDIKCQFFQAAIQIRQNSFLVTRCKIILLKERE